MNVWGYRSETNSLGVVCAALLGRFGELRQGLVEHVLRLVRVEILGVDGLVQAVCVVGNEQGEGRRALGGPAGAPAARPGCGTKVPIVALKPPVF